MILFHHIIQILALARKEKRGAFADAV